MDNTTAKKEIVRYLTGDSFDTDKMASAVHVLAQPAPDELVALRQKILGEHEERCQDVSELLQDYSSLGDQMPEVNQHLQSCPFCSAELAMLQEIVEEQQPAWKVFAQEIAETKQQPILLIMCKEMMWMWTNEQRQKLRKLTKKDTDLNKPVGNWYLQYAGATSIHLANVEKPCCLSIDLPKKIAHIKLIVTPEYQKAEKEKVWNLHFDLDQASQISQVLVSIGNNKKPSSGLRNLLKAQPLNFNKLEPPYKDYYWIYFSWQDREETWQEYKTALPLLSE